MITWLGALLLVACGHTSSISSPTDDYLMVKQGERAWRLNDQALVFTVEEQLSAQGFDPGPVDGIADGRLRQALCAYQQARGLEPHGALDENTSHALGLRWRRVRADLRSARLEP